jgi:putative transcriptional regulator
MLSFFVALVKTTNYTKNINWLIQPIQNLKIGGIRLVENNIAVLRKKKKISQKELAEKVGIGNDWLCDIEKGKGTPSLELVKNLADALEVRISDIFSE